MLDESIPSSPSKQNDSIRRLRARRKIRRPVLGEGSVSSEMEEGGRRSPLNVNLLEALYESEQDTSEILHNISALNFNPFKNEVLLAKCDRRTGMELKRYDWKADLRGAKAFETCEAFMEQQDANPEDDPLMSLEDYGISNTEFLNVCIEAEEKYNESTSQTPTQTPKAKTVVDLILEDFCGSPSSPELRNSCTSETDTPVFLFRHQPLRTYSERCKIRRRARSSLVEKLNNAETGAKEISGVDPENSKLNQELQSKDVVVARSTDSLKEVPSPLGRHKTLPANSRLLSRCRDLYDYDVLNSDCSSDLSVQDGHTQQIESHEDKMELSHSQRLCENLQNLSAFFTSTHNTTVIEDNGTATRLKESSEITDMYLTALDGSSGYHCKNSGGDVETLQSLNALPPLLREIIVLQRKRKYSLKRETSNSSLISFCGFSTDEEDESAIEKRSDSLSSFHELSTDKIDEPEECNDRNTTSGDKTITDECAVKDEDTGRTSVSEWDDDCEIFLNALPLETEFPQMEKSYDDENQVAPLAENICFGFQTASKKRIEVSAEAERRAAQILQFENLSIAMETNEQEDTRRDSGKRSSKETENKVDLVQDNLDDLENIQFSEWIMNDRNNVETESPKRSIEMSNLPKNSNDNDHDSAHSNYSNPLAPLQFSAWNVNQQENLNNETPQVLIGFHTASKKSIQISDDAKQKAMNILAKLPELSHKKDDATTKVNALQGFRTASRKPITISEAAKQKALRICEELSVAECDTKNWNPNVNRNECGVNIPEMPLAQDDLNNVVFSEWPLCDEDELIKSCTTESDEILGKRKLADVNKGTPERPSKTFCNSKTTSNVLRTPLNRIENDNHSKALRDLAVHTPLNSKMRNRKNLLSLNKVKQRMRLTKHNAESTPFAKNERCNIRNEHVVASHTPDTPNLKEFFDLIPCASTPRQRLRKCEIPVAVEKEKKPEAVELETEFKQIKWENHNESGNNSNSNNNHNNSRNQKHNSSIGSKHGNLSDSNVTFCESNPSCQQRMQRLTMYANPPAVSPISFSNSSSFRRIGLSRSSNGSIKNKKN